MAGTGIRLTPGGVVTLALCCLAPDDLTFCAVLLSVLCHELGHLSAMRLCHIHGGVTIHLLGAAIDCGGVSYRAQRLVALAGPLAGAVLTASCLLLRRAADWALLPVTAGVSAALTVFNLLPVLPLDGGVFLRAFFLQHLDQRGERLSQRLSVAVSACLVLGAAAAAMAREGWMLLPPALALAVWNVKSPVLQSAPD